MTAPKYSLRFWGARGTVPSPAAAKLRYGGNTSCLALTLDDREHLILDCGSGVRHFGTTLRANPDDLPMRFHIFLSHYHFDHVEGLPLFTPLYKSNSVIKLYGLSTCGMGARQILEQLIRPPYFPVTLAETPSKVDYLDANAGPFKIHDITIDSLPLNHPDGCLAFRLRRGDRCIVYATDHEHGHAATDRALIEFTRGADHLIYDATYQPGEYEELRKGWGHSTWYAAVQTALQSEIKNLILSHHHPDHTDDELDRVLEVARKEFPNTTVSHEGLELPL
jgi:phosphoribosyl 1,2-cyclic phosphodiesterase